MVLLTQGLRPGLHSCAASRLMKLCAVKTINVVIGVTLSLCGFLLSGVPGLALFETWDSIAVCTRELWEGTASSVPTRLSRMCHTQPYDRRAAFAWAELTR